MHLLAQPSSQVIIPQQNSPTSDALAASRHLRSMDLLAHWDSLTAPSSPRIVFPIGCHNSSGLVYNLEPLILLHSYSHYSPKRRPRTSFVLHISCTTLAPPAIHPDTPQRLMRPPAIRPHKPKPIMRDTAIRTHTPQRLIRMAQASIHTFPTRHPATKRASRGQDPAAPRRRIREMYRLKTPLGMRVRRSSITTLTTMACGRESGRRLLVGWTRGQLG